MARYIYSNSFDEFVHHISVEDINTRDPLTGKTVLEIAADENRARYFDFMIKKVFDLKAHQLSHAKGQIKDSLNKRLKFLSTEYNAGYSRLHVAVMDGEPDMIRYILRNELCDPNTADVPIGSPVQLAILLCHVECIKALVEFCVDVDIVNKHNQTALQMAVEHDIIALVPELFILSRNINAARYMEFTYLQLAIICDWRALLPILLQISADVHLPITMPDDLAMTAAVERFSRRPSLIPLSSVETALSFGLKLHGELQPCLLTHICVDLVDMPDGHGNSLLILAASVQNLDLCETLLLREANINFYNHSGNNALQEMLRTRSLFPHKIKRPVAVGTLLVNAGIDVNKDSWDNNKILKDALTINNEKFFNLILQKTSVVDYSMVNINTIVKRRWFSTANILLGTMSDSMRDQFITGDLVYTFWKQAKPEETEAFLHQIGEQKIHLLLDMLADQKDLNLFKSVLETTEVSSNLLDNGETLLTNLILKSNKEFIDVVLESSKREGLLNCQNKLGQRPLHVAIRMQNKELIELFVLEDVSFNTQDINGDTVLGLLFRNFTDKNDVRFVEKTAKIMINGGAKLNMLDANKIQIVDYCSDPVLKERLTSFASRKSAAMNSLKIETECRICLSNPVECALECGHVYCSQCVIRCTKCPSCRMPSRSITKLYF